MLYDLALAPLEALGLRETRARVAARARGRVLEAGAGTGLMLAHYPAAVSQVVVCEPDAVMRRRLAERAAHVPFEVGLSPLALPGPSGASPLPFADASFDTVVCVLVLCTIGDVPGALREIRRLLRPDGQLLFLEHVVTRTALAALQRRLTPAWARIAGGCELDRDTISAIKAADFVITDCERPSPMGRLTAQMVVEGRAIPRQAA